MRAYAVARIALLTLFILALASLPGLTNSARASAPADESAGHVRVIYWVDQTLGSSYVANVMITNMTADPIEDWNMLFNLDPVADNIRSAQFTVSGISHRVTGAGWTSTIKVGESVWFSIDGSIPGNGVMDDVNSVPRPTDCVFQGEACTFESVSGPQPNPQDTLGVDVGWWVASQGVTQFRAQILMKNISDQKIDYWTLRFRSNSLITNIEHGDWTRTGANYEVTGRGWTNSIDPDEVIWLTLTGVHGGQVDTLESCIFNGFPCSFVDPDDFVDAPEEPDIPGGLCQVVPVGGTDSQSGGSAGIRLDWTPTSFWSTGYTYAIDIYNDSDDAVRDWELKFQLPNYMTISQLWNADWSRSGTSVTVRALPHNACIEPGGVVKIGFEGEHDGRAEPPSSCLFGGADCIFSRISTVATNTEPGLTQPGAEFELEAAYPNPFATETHIPFRVSETQHVQVTLWDMQGRQIGYLFDGTAAAGQSYRINVPAGTLHSGVYLVRLVGASGFGVSTPVMLVR
jgi:cellulose binding protein with CBM2 domain/type IX secretion system substrate protein